MKWGKYLTHVKEAEEYNTKSDGQVMDLNTMDVSLKLIWSILKKNWINF